MKNFRAIYDTNTYKGIKYDFQAKNMESAEKFAEGKFESYNDSSFELIELK